MLEVDVLRMEEHRGVHDEGDPSRFAQLPSSDDSVSNSDNDTNRSSFITELILNKSSQTDYIAKMKNSMFYSHGQKPYDQLSDREKQRLIEKQTRRVLKVRGEMRRYGINRSISQSGKDDLIKFNNCVIGHRRRENSTCSVGSLDSCEDLSSSLEDEEELEKNLESWYQANCGEDYFVNDRSRFDLVRNYMDMEDKIEELQNALRQARIQQNVTRRTFNVEEEMEKIRVFREEIETLMRENNLLQIENDKLRLRLPSKGGE